MKKVLLISLILAFLVGLSVWAYETAIIDFPPNQRWIAVYYRHIGTEAILQYVPDGESYENWTQSVVIHSYKENLNPANELSDILIGQMVAQNPTSQYRYVRNTGVDAIAVRVTNDYKDIKGHGEIFRTTHCAEGRMTFQYLDRDKERFRKTYGYWLKIIREAKTFNSYWRDNRILNKGDYFEL